MINDTQKSAELTETDSDEQEVVEEQLTVEIPSNVQAGRPTNLPPCVYSF
ncbi:MAG: hypothetical protein JWN04_5749 [Myxococcaceae bacterium]|nr:hypothetical protein [Myxococcaceae bacterium]